MLYKLLSHTLSHFNSPNSTFSVSPYSLEIQKNLASFCIFPSPVLESDISSRSLVPLLEHGVRNQDLGARCAHCYWSAIVFRRLQQADQGDICVYTIPYMYTQL